MPKNIVQDVIPRGNRKSIRDVSPSRESRIFNEIAARKVEEDVVLKVVRDTYRVEREEGAGSFKGHPSSRSPRLVLWSMGVVSTIVLVVILGNVFSSATLTVTPRSQKVPVNLNLTAKPKAVAGELSYTSLNLVRDKEEIVAADGEKPAESRSSGRIIIYNNYSTSAQRLVKNTRFETPDGLIYKVADSVTVSGRKSVAGESVPGSVEALVYAETVGEEYNIGLTDFTIPGFKSNTERFNSFYGRSKTPMTGGRIGMEKVVSDEKMTQARARLEGSLKQELLDEAAKLVPAEAVFYHTAYRIEFEPVLSGAIVKGDNVSLRERARFTAFFIKRDELAETIAGSALDNYGDMPIDVANIENLEVEIKTKGKYSPTSVGPIEFNVKGEAELVWSFEGAKLKGDLVDKNKSKLSEIIGKYPSIVKADVTIRPFWKSTFPSKDSKIRIVTDQNSD